jgi:hypothetical protein
MRRRSDKAELRIKAIDLALRVIRTAYDVQGRRVECKVATVLGAADRIADFIETGVVPEDSGIQGIVTVLGGVDEKTATAFSTSVNGWQASGE